MNNLSDATTVGKIFIVCCLSMIICHVNVVEASSKYVNGGCANDGGNYTQGSTYQDKLNLLFSNFSSQASIVKFHNFATGDVPNKVFGLFQCREDLSLDVCRGCVRHAIKRIVQDCPLYSEAIVWYDECMVRYANRSIFSLYEWSPLFTQHSLLNVSNYDEFAPVITKTINGLISDAALSLRIATGEDNLSSTSKVYCLAQCSPDLDRFGCDTCLRTAFAELRSCCNASIYAKVFLPSCQLRYDMNPFYNQTIQRMPITEIPGKTLKPSVIAGIAVASFVAFALLIVSIWLCARRITGKKNSMERLNSASKVLHTVTSDGAEGFGDANFVQYDFATLSVATNNFFKDNKLGQGGFGPVYKGTLKGGQQIAIKRLSANSGQGAIEFMNEARLVAKLQHKNLVNLVGFCSEGNEKLLVYEFMPNTSLDHILFDPQKQQFLGWETRYKIVIGIARGLQYLHEDSRLTIIHRDLKTGNILLDGDMNPKIADFGTAKLFGDGQKLGNTSRIIGTYGYMAPEYALIGEYSEKSDVYSFGIMILEILSGQTCKTFYQLSQKDLAAQAWKLWNEDRAFELMDPTIYSSCSKNEVKRCIEIGLLCVQGNATDRPTMGAVVLMLTGSVVLPLPLAPMMADYDSYDDESCLDQSTTKSSSSSIEVEKDLYQN